MEKYAFFLLIILAIGLLLSAIKTGKYVTKARWFQGFITIFTLVMMTLWFVLQSQNNLKNSTIITKNAQELKKSLDKTYIFGSREERNHLSTIKFSIFTSLNFLLLFLNFVLMINNVRVERKVIV